MKEKNNTQGSSKESIVDAVNLALDRLLTFEVDQVEHHLCSCNEPPAPEFWVLLLLIAWLGKKQVEDIRLLSNNKMMKKN